MKKQEKTLKVTTMAMLTAVSIVLIAAIRFPIFPSANFLEYDPADIPVLICAMVLGPIPGIIVLFASCLIQALTVSSGSGIIGFFMHFIASAVLILLTSLIYRTKKNSLTLIIGLIAGSVAMVIVMIPLNLVFTGIFMNVGVDVVKGMLIPTIIPFNLIKAGVNSAITYAIFKPVSRSLESYMKVN